MTELIDHPGETRALARAVPPEVFGDDPWGPTVTDVSDPVRLDLHLDSVVEGILVRGNMLITVEVPCSRCLVPQRIDRDVAVAELFQDPTKRYDDEEDDPGYELIDDRTAIDLTTMVRDALVIDLPLQVRCRPDCQGLCPTCGADRNKVDCGHWPKEVPDPRWAALADLDVPADGD